MRRHPIGLLVTLALGLLVPPLTAEAQPLAKVPRIGWLLKGSPFPPWGPLDAFRQGLRERGWVEGQNIAVEERWAEGRIELLPDLAADLIRLKVDVIVVAGPLTARAAKQATTELPIVILGVGDALGQGLVTSLARPRGNITGLSEQYSDLVTKWLELLKEAVPEASRGAVLAMAPFWSAQGKSWQALQRAAKTMQVTLQRVEVREPGEFEHAFAAMTREYAEALIMLPHPTLTLRLNRTRLVALAAQSQLPTVWGPFKEFVEAGGLMAYGPSIRDQARRVAYYVDRILKGAKPADLPVEQPTKFELVINLKTAQALGITIPPTLLFLADEVIR
jgi:putative tryptophan/tyrosine transport system substrate-binding protein